MQLTTGKEKVQGVFRFPLHPSQSMQILKLKCLKKYFKVTNKLLIFPLFDQNPLHFAPCAMRYLAEL